jgi:hypothetical protein
MTVLPVSGAISSNRCHDEPEGTGMQPRRLLDPVAGKHESFGEMNVPSRETIGCQK